MSSGTGSTAASAQSPETVREYRQARRIRELLNRIEELEARVESLEAVSLAEVPSDLAGVLTSTEARLLGFLVRKPGVVSKQQLMELLYEQRSSGEVPETKVVDVFVCKIRRKLKPFGIDVATVWGQGYCLAAPDRARLKALEARA